MSEELKPCPFCGAKASVQRYSSGTGGPKCAVWCDACHVGTSWLHGDDGEARVVAEWNHRAPAAVRELDVEAERPGSHHLTMENVAAVIKDLREIADGTTERSIYSRDWVVYSGVLALIIEWLAARRAAPAPVSTEQAGDAQSVRNAALEAAASLCDRFATRDMHPAECAGAIRMMKKALNEMAAPSPNNSPVGGKGEQ